MNRGSFVPGIFIEFNLIFKVLHTSKVRIKIDQIQKKSDKLMLRFSVTVPRVFSVGLALPDSSLLKLDFSKLHIAAKSC